MATRSFLLSDDLETGRALLLDGARFPDALADSRRKFSLWLEDRLLARFSRYGDFAALKPVLLGSWARHELTPKSDIDLLFAGPEAEVRAFVQAAFKDGLKLRARTPENPEDWSVGVEPFDILALKFSRAFAPDMAWQADAQREHAGKRRREIYRAIRAEREERRRRQDSVSSYLEPNLKYGAGGLRDIEQALALRELFAGNIRGVDTYPFEVLAEIKERFLFLRALAHLGSAGDLLSAHDQLELAKSLGVESGQALMKLVQSELERGSFYADWVTAYCGASEKKRASARDRLGTAGEGLNMLRADPSLLRQFEVRRKIDKWKKDLAPTEHGKLLHRALHDDAPDDFLVALYRTRWFELLIPDFRKLKGLVQHDHYHRYTADAHLVQTLREVQRARSHPRLFGVIYKLTKDLNPGDWWTLKLTALFHDLAKGRKGDHSTEGAALARHYFAAWGYPEALAEDVAWLVENHLLLSTAAFRQNPQAKTTWKRLFARGVEGRRLVLLALFTAIDIRATNPEAWTPWKAQLLHNLVENLRSPEAQSFQLHLRYARQKQRRKAEEWLLATDPLLLELISPRVLVEDLHAAAEAKGDLPVKVFRAREKGIWVRFHRKVDQPGLFLGFVRQLYGLGLSIQMSSVHTLPEVGVYDWFSLRTEKPARQIAKWLALPSAVTTSVPQVEFQSIDLMAQEEEEWILSFKGKDQRGLLLAAAHSLYEERLSLRWARAHTWGRQVEDVFSVRPLGEVEALLSRLRSRFVT